MINKAYNILATLWCYLFVVICTQQQALAEPVDLYVKGRAVPLSYQQQLASWLSKYQFYPQAAKKLHLEGVVFVSATINSDGTVLKTEIEKPSGSEILDQAALQLLKQASPLPAFPDNFESDEITFTAPISYNLKSIGK